MKNLFCGLLLTFLASCSVAPLNTTTTARSLGENVNQIKWNAITTGLEYERGLTPNLDLGFGIEAQDGTIYNLFSKYAFINNADHGFSFAGLIGVGYSPNLIKSKSIYAGPVFSYRFDSLELFTTLRFNHTDWSNQLNDGSADDIISYLPRNASINYGQADVGVNFMNGKWFCSTGLKILVFEDASGILPFFDIAYKF